LYAMQVKLLHDGIWLCTSDRYHVRENYHDQYPYGWLIRDYRAWVHSDALIKGLQRTFHVKLIFSHDSEVAKGFIDAKKYYE
jgi:hypothetical protein